VQRWSLDLRTPVHTGFLDFGANAPTPPQRALGIDGQFSKPAVQIAFGLVPRFAISGNWSSPTRNLDFASARVLEASGSFSGISGSVHLVSAIAMGFSGISDLPYAQFVYEYVNSVPRGAATSVISKTSVSSKVLSTERLAWGISKHKDSSTRVESGEAKEFLHEARADWLTCDIRPSGGRITWESGKEHLTKTNGKTTLQKVLDKPKLIPWSLSATKSNLTRSSVDILVERFWSFRNRYGLSKTVKESKGNRWGSSKSIRRYWRIPWIPSKWPRSGHGAQIIPIPVYPNRGVLNFCYHPKKLEFKRRCQFILPITNAYYVMNSGSLVLVSNNSDIPVSSISLSSNLDSWCWTLSAESQILLPAISRGSEVKATINGFQFLAKLDSVSPSRSFRSDKALMSGRSISSIMHEPWSEPVTFTEEGEKNAQNICLDLLPQGWSLDWKCVDWIIPAGTFSCQNKTAISIIMQIASACGAVVQSDRIEKILHVIPKWTISPWLWDNAEILFGVPAAYITSVGSQAVNGNDCNSIVVTNEKSGDVFIATIDGTDGSKIAATVSDHLITSPYAAMARASKEVAESVSLSHRSFVLDIAQEPDGVGLILPGQMLQITGTGFESYRGLVTSVSIKAGVSGGGMLSVTQNIETFML